MASATLIGTDPWRLEILMVRDSHSASDRRALSRDVQRGLLLPVRRGAYVERLAYLALTAEDQHIVRMRALAATSPRPVVFSHWSAGLLHGLPVLRSRLDVLHVTVEDDSLRHRQSVSSHLFRVLPEEIVQLHEVLATGVGRTVVDIAGAAPFEEGVMAADGALRAGVPRALLELAADLAGGRRAGRRISDVTCFAHPGSESAGESRMRCTMFRLGVEPPELQHRIALAGRRSVFLDGWFRSVNVGVEFDGESKYRDAEMAPEGPAQAVIVEKRREDEMRNQLAGLVRLGWVQAGSTSRLRTLLAGVGVVAPRPRTDLRAWADSAARSRPRS